MGERRVHLSLRKREIKRDFDSMFSRPWRERVRVRGKPNPLTLNLSKGKKIMEVL